MNHTALIWTLAIMLAFLSILLAIDLIFSWRNNCRKAKTVEHNAARRERENTLCTCTEINKLGTCAEPAEVDEVESGSACDGEHSSPLRDTNGRRAESSRATKILRCAQNDTEKSNVINGIDLCGRERPVFEVKLPPDGKLLHLLTPTKATSDRFQEIGMLLERQEQGRLSPDGMEQLYKFAAILLSNNKEQCAFLPADVKERLSAEDIGALLQQYLLWLTDLIKARN